MKFTELKNRFKNKFTIRVIAGVLMVAVLGTGYGAWQVTAAKAPVEESAGENSEEATDTEEEDREALKEQLGNLWSKDASQEEVGKEETVYMLSDATGKVEETIVSDWLKNTDGAQSLTDASDLVDIENVKGDETFTKDGETLVWEANGNDIFYQGSTDKEAPLTQQITYYLDGEEISPQELAGASGRVTMHFTFTNQEKKTYMINGKAEDIYVPFAVVTGMVLGDNFTNLEVTNGKVISDGKNNIVLGITTPGFKDSLGVTEKDFDEEVTFPEYLEVTADVENFNMDMTLSVASSDLLSDMNVNGTLDLSVLSDTINEMSNASNQLVDGSSDLAEGLDTLKSSLAEYANGVNQLADGLGTLAGSTTTLITGVNTLNSSAQSVAGGIEALNRAVSTAMTEEEKMAAKTQAVAAVDAQLSNPEYAMNYENVKALAKQQISGDTTIQAMVKTMVEQQMIASVRANATASAAINNLMVSNGMTEVEATKAVMDSTYGAGVYDATFRQNYDAALASFADAMAVSVADTAKQAAESAAGDAAIAGAESAKATIKDSINATQPSGYSLVSGVQALATGTQSMAEQMPTLSQAMSQLVGGSATLKDGTTQLVSGVNQLEEGSNTLADGMAQFDEEAIAKIADTYNGDLKELVDRLTAVLDEGNEYTTFTKTADGMKGSVKFVWETAAIKADK